MREQAISLVGFQDVASVEAFIRQWPSAKFELAYTMSFFQKWVGLFPEGFTFSNYTRIPHYSHKELFNSFYLSIVATLLCAVLGSIVAYITERKKPKGAALLDLSVMTGLHTLQPVLS